MTAPGSNAAHSALVNDVLVEIGALHFVRCWKRTVGTFYRPRYNDLGQASGYIAVQIGEAGEPDIDGILRRWDGLGLRFGVECKTGGATLSPDQKRYRTMILSMGGIYIEGRDPKIVRARIQEEHERGKPA